MTINILSCDVAVKPTVTPLRVSTFSLHVSTLDVMIDNKMAKFNDKFNTFSWSISGSGFRSWGWAHLFFPGVASVTQWDDLPILITPVGFPDCEIPKVSLNRSATFFDISVCVLLYFLNFDKLTNV